MVSELVRCSVTSPDEEYWLVAVRTVKSPMIFFYIRVVSRNQIGKAYTQGPFHLPIIIRHKFIHVLYVYIMSSELCSVIDFKPLLKTSEGDILR